MPKSPKTARRVVTKDGIAGPESVQTQVMLDDGMPRMPEPDVLDRQLAGVLDAMNIPKAKVAELMQQSNEKKWHLVWAQMKVVARHPPSFYLESLLAHLDAIDKQRRKKAKVKKLPPGVEPVSTILRGLEISLRTNTLEWVQQFINYQVTEKDKKDKEKDDVAGPKYLGGLDILMDYFVNMDDEGRDNMDDYLCVLCLRALMNNAFGFNSVMAHADTINQICLCLGTVDPFHGEAPAETLARKYRTHILVLELLAAVCLVPKGHPRVLEAFDAFARNKNEKVRFQTLMHLLRSERHNVAVVVACMAFINVVVHCVNDMNYQVALQHEFTQLGLMKLIEDMFHIDAPELREQLEAYQDNFVNVSDLARDAELHEQDQEIIEELQEETSRVKAKALIDEERNAQYIESLQKEVADQRALTDTVIERLETEKEESMARQTKLQQELSTLRAEMAVLMEAAARTQAELEESKSVSAMLKKLNTSPAATSTVAKEASFGFGDAELDARVGIPGSVPEPVAAPPPPPPPAPAPPPPTSAAVAYCGPGSTCI
eukprot:m.90967 g.90967  ORF g.90967 m.90967 type:complete len:545 (+) comp13717_c0_seq3:162-1796(+)